jgi:UDP-2,3-diacylglucosamine pyrophosphatase LpxH
MRYNERRQVEVVVISDVHLGTYGCHASELVRYLKSIAPKKLILNGDIVDIWQFSKKYFPKEHMAVIKEITRMLSHGAEVIYITGNHDEMFRKFAGHQIGNLTIDNKYLLELDGKTSWIFHGDVFDVTMKYSPWIAHLGGKGYDLLILLNRAVNHYLEKIGKEKISLSKKIKDGVKAAVKFIDDFEQTAIRLGIRNGYDFVICGHIHKACIRHFKNEEGEITYLNSGDWIENLTALEYNEGQWSLFEYDKAELPELDGADEKDKLMSLNSKELFQLLSFEITAARA